MPYQKEAILKERPFPIITTTKKEWKRVKRCTFPQPFVSLGGFNKSRQQ
jgi:hypothetical protein